jgi:hypothetical protein
MATFNGIYVQHFHRGCPILAFFARACPELAEGAGVDDAWAVGFAT